PLAQELGLDPGPTLQQLELAILARDPSLDPPASRDASAVADSRPSNGAARAPPTARPPDHRRGVRLVLGASVLAVAVLIAALIASSVGGTPPPTVVAANSVGAISPSRGGIRAVVPLGTSPQALAAGEGAV